MPYSMITTPTGVEIEVFRPPRKKPVGKYFSVSLGTLEEVIQHREENFLIQPLIAYLVLCKFQIRGEPFTTAGAPAIAKVLDISRHQAEQILDELKTIHWGSNPRERAITNVKVLDKKFPVAVNTFPTKGLPRKTDQLLAIPNSFFGKKTINRHQLPD